MFQFKSKLLKTARPSDELLRSRYNATDEDISLASQVDNDKFLEWVLKNYKKKLIQLPEDGAKLREQLAWFSRMKNSPKFKEKYSPDINQYNPSTLYEAFNNDETQELSSQNQKDKEVIAKGSKIVYNQDGVLVYEVHDYKALMLLSSNTNWCTAQESYATHYLKSGPNYVVYKDGKPYAQYDPGTGQLMNPKDVSLRSNLKSLGLVSDPLIPELGKVIPAFSKFKTLENLSEVEFRKGDPQELLDICKLRGGRWPEAEPYIMKDPAIAYDYARDFIKGRWPEAEPIIMKEPSVAVNYTRDVIQGRWPEAEPYIMEKPLHAYVYARDIIKGRWPEAEPSIMKPPGDCIYVYAKDVIKGRWPEAEPYIMMKAKTWWGINMAYNYAKAVIQGRWPEAEPIIMKDPSVAVNYARDVIQGRWPEAEPYIKKSKTSWKSYQSFLESKKSHLLRSQGALRPEQREFFEAGGQPILEEEQIGPYTLFVSTAKIPHVIHQIGLQRDGQDLFDQNLSVPNLPAATLSEFKDILESWLYKYGELWVSSHNLRKNKIYAHILQKMGFNPKPIPFGHHTLYKIEF